MDKEQVLLDEVLKCGFKPKSNDDKYDWWVGICEGLIERYSMQKSSGAITEREHDELVKEIKGGICPQCKTPYRAIEFNNVFGMGLYYRPKCGCAPRCHCCHRIMNREYVAGFLVDDFFCLYCGWPITKGAYKQFYDRMGERAVNSIRRQEKILALNEIGMPCAGCGKDLWYELKAGMRKCLKCGRKIEENTTTHKHQSGENTQEIV